MSPGSSQTPHHKTDWSTRIVCVSKIRYDGSHGLSVNVAENQMIGQATTHRVAGPVWPGKYIVIRAILKQTRLRWAGLVIRMPDTYLYTKAGALWRAGNRDRRTTKKMLQSQLKNTYQLLQCGLWRLGGNSL